MKIKGMLFILFAACAGHIGAMEPDKKAGPKQQGMQQGTKVPSLKQQALIAKAKNIVQEIHCSPQQALDAYKTSESSDFLTLPIDLQSPLLAEIGRQYYMLYGIELNTGVPWGLSIQDFLDSPVLQNQRPQITTCWGQNTYNLSNMKINDLNGLQNIPNIKTVVRLDLDNNQLTTIQPNAFAGLTSLMGISLEINQLTTIQPKAFAGLPNLKNLFLSNNKLTTIPPNAFAGLPNLGWLFLDYNQLTTIPTNAFAGLNNLQRLQLQQNPLNEKTKEAIRKAIKALPQRVTIIFK